MSIQVRPDALAWQVFRGTDAMREGLVTPNSLRGRSWQRLRQDVYAESRLQGADWIVLHATSERVSRDFAAAHRDPLGVVLPRLAPVLTGLAGQGPRSVPGPQEVRCDDLGGGRDERAGRREAR